jgi:hypothetical protein
MHSFTPQYYCPHSYTPILLHSLRELSGSNNLKTLVITMNKTLKFILEMAIAVLTAILTTLGVTSCM